MLLWLRKKINFHPRQILHHLRIRNWSQAIASHYWSNHSDQQPVYKYANYSNWTQLESALLYAIAKLQKPKEDVQILEIGCNIGTNLRQLRELGYTKLVGIEIKTEVINLIHPDFEIKHMDITELDHDITADVVFTSAVLMHIKNLTFLSLIKTKYFITFESENYKAPFMYKRNYQKVFAKLGYREVGKTRFVFNKNYMTRLFEREIKL